LSCFRSGYPGLAVDSGEFPELHKNLPQANVKKLLQTVLTPANVEAVLRRAGCPPRPLVLKIDIDSWDGVLLEAALSAFEPDIVHLEINPDFPPPLQFAIQYDPRYEHSGTAGFYGCSLSYALAVARPAGYELLQVDLSEEARAQDATLVKREHLPLFGVAPPVDERTLFLREPFGGWRGLIEIGIETRPWRQRSDYAQLLREVRDACVAASSYRSGTVLPFVLSV
jgi:hypothetical protein